MWEKLENLLYTTEFVRVQRSAIDIIFFYNILVILAIVLRYVIALDLLLKIPLETCKINN